MADAVMAGNVLAGPDGTKALYGFSPTRGNGCCTYVKASALKAAGLDPDKVANETMTYDQYYDMLKKIQAASSNKNYVISTSGFVAGGNKPEAPYTNYLPEFYQDAQFTFYLKDGKYVDGFSEEAMKKAMDRLKTAIDDKILDPATHRMLQQRKLVTSLLIRTLTLHLQYLHTGLVHGIRTLLNYFQIRQTAL